MLLCFEILYVLWLCFVANVVTDTGQATCPVLNRYRTFDGSCNNLANPTWGQAGTAYRRFMDADGNPMVDYHDDVHLPRGGFPTTLPSPRLVSNMISNSSLGPVDQTDNARSLQNMAFGQLMAHDFVKTRIPLGTDCCNSSHPLFSDTGHCFTFDIPTDDTVFTPGCRSFIRAANATEDANLPAYRENINDLSAYIDAGFLYGSSDAEVTALRDGDTYLMKTGTGNLLPLKNGGACVRFHGKCPIAVQCDGCHAWSRSCFPSGTPDDTAGFCEGDTRVAETCNLGMMHLLWLREHNRIAKMLDDLNPKITTTYPYITHGIFYQETREDIIFQETRRIITAMVQHITYNHYLPTFLDAATMSTYNLSSKATGYDDRYDTSVDASIRNGFGTAPFRFGHSQIGPHMSLLHDDYKTINQTLLEDNLKNPQIYLINDGANVENLARWLTYIAANQIDSFAVSSVRDKLFMHTETPAQDLFSLNIQRGRDQGTPDFNRWRQFCRLSNMTFEDFGMANQTLRDLYGTADKIDFFIGGLLEEGTDGGVGRTFACVIGKQLELLKKGDRYWYERSDSNLAFTEAQVNTIKQGASLSRIICQNFGLAQVQADVFRTGDQGSLKDCNTLPDIDLNLWKLDSSGANRLCTLSMLCWIVVILCRKFSC